MIYLISLNPFSVSTSSAEKMSIAAAAKTVAAATRSMSAEAAAKAATAAAAGISTIDGVERFVYNSKGMVKSFAVEDMRPTKLDHGKWKSTFSPPPSFRLSTSCFSSCSFGVICRNTLA